MIKVGQTVPKEIIQAACNRLVSLCIGDVVKRPLKEELDGLYITPVLPLSALSHKLCEL